MGQYQSEIERLYDYLRRVAGVQLDQDDYARIGKVFESASADEVDFLAGQAFHTADEMAKGGHHDSEISDLLANNIENYWRKVFSKRQIAAEEALFGKAKPWWQSL